MPLPCQVGTFQVFNIQVNGVAITTPTFSFRVLSTVISVTKSSISGPGLANAQAGTPAFFTFLAVDQFDNPVEYDPSLAMPIIRVEVRPPKNSPETRPPDPSRTSLSSLREVRAPLPRRSAAGGSCLAARARRGLSGTRGHRPLAGDFGPGGRDAGDGRVDPYGGL
eukprot:678030-Prorocentrum_minimum.AAC.1